MEGKSMEPMVLLACQEFMNPSPKANETSSIPSETVVDLPSSFFNRRRRFYMRRAFLFPISSRAAERKSHISPLLPSLSQSTSRAMETTSLPPPSQPPKVVAGTVAVVGSQYCAPYPVDLTITQKALSVTEGDFVVTDVNENLLMKVKGKVFSIRDKRLLVDAAGNPIVTMREKLLTAHDTWRVFRGDSTDDNDMLFTVKRSSIVQLKSELNVFLASNTQEQVCDFKVKGSYFDRSCTVYLGDCQTVLAQMHKKYKLGNLVLGKDTYGVTIYPNVDYAFVVSLVVILDQINQESRD